MKNTFAAFLLLLLVSISSGGRANRLQNECMVKCNEYEDRIFKLGKAYTYLHQGESKIQTINGTYDSTGLLIKSKVIITAVSKCQMKLTMSEVEILDKVSNNENKFKPTPFTEEAKEILERNDVLFARFNDNVRSVCVNKDEPIWAQNLKKSIIDIIANNGNDYKSMEQRETRHGTCYVEKSVADDKTKTLSYNIKSCESSTSQSLFTDLTEAVAFDVSEVKCKYAYQSTEDPQVVHCTEEYNTTPLQEYGNRITVQVTTRLERIESKTSDMSYPNKDLTRTGIQMTNDPGEMREVYYTEAKEAIKLLCELQTSKSISDIPRTFMTLVNRLKKLTSSQMKEVYTTSQKTDLCPGLNDEIRTMFNDAIGFVNTPAATSVMVDLIKNKQISEIDQTVWFTSLSFMKTTPTLEMIKDLETLLQSDEINKQKYLGISAVTHLYCKKNYESCLMDHTIRNILSFFMKNIGKDCSATEAGDNLSNLQISLKALGNLKLFNDDVVTILTKCVSTKSNPTAIRVSALEVMKHMGCEKDRSVAMDILQDNENDSEMRINSYLMVMGCPDINTMFKVRKVLLKEKVNQVGSFIWTHLTNIQESNDRLKFDIQTLLNDVELKTEFDLSKLKFSRNIEKTFSTNRFGMTLDSNIIFSEKSFIPRSLSVNTTATVLGRSTNFIEMSARMEGFDDLLFKLLGPDGYLKKKGVANAAQDNMKLIKMLEEVNGNFNFKMFGQQISFVELIRGSLSSVRKYNIIEELLKLGEGQSIDFRKNLVLLDSVANIPTSLGFSLKLTVQGSVAVKLKVKSKLDISGLMKWPISLNIDSNIIPSVMSEVTSEITMETPFSNYGMSMSLKSGTDTEFNAIISANKNEDLTIKFDTPKKKQEILTISGKSFVIYRNQPIEQLTNKIQKFDLCTQEMMVRILGIRVCATAEITDANTRKTALLYGPFSANIFIEKADTQSGYVIRGLFKTVPFISQSGVTYQSRFIKFEFDTPESRKYYRRFSFEMSLDFKSNMAKFQFITPWSNALIRTTFKFTDEQKLALFIVDINQNRIVQIAVEHQSLLTKTRRTERGLIALRILHLQPFETNWEFIGKKDEWKVKFTSKGFLKDNTYFKMDVKEVISTRELSLSNKYKLSGSYASYFGKGQISGSANSNYYGHRWDITVKHSATENPKNVYMIKYSHKTEDKSSKSLLKHFLTSTISYGENAENFVKFKIENELSMRHVRTSIKTNYGKRESNDLKSSGEMDLQLYGGYSWKEDGIHYAEGSLTFKFPSKAINYEGRYNSEIGKRMFKMSLVLDDDQTSKVNLKINYLQPKLYLNDIEFDILFSLPGHTTNMNWALTEVDVNKYKYSFSGKYNKHLVKIDGVQTEISKLKYDSSVKIVMPAAKYWPEKINIDLRVDFVNAKDARLNGKIEVPNSNLKYSLDLKLSTMLENFLQLPMSEKNSVFRYTVEIANVDRTIKSESIFTCNPEEVQVYFNFAWNAKQNKDQQITFDFHTFHKSPNYKQYASTALIAVHYPGNSHSIGFKSNFKYTELDAQIEIMWNKKQKISILTTYEIDNNWTEMGLKSAITVKTPFPGLESTHLSINAIGQLRYRKVEIEFNWSGNKKILFDIVVHPRSSNDFTLTSKLVTPFKGVNLVSLQAVHIITKNSRKSEIVVELGPSQRYNIKFEGINNSEGNKRDYGSNLEVESGIFPPIKMSFIHKDDKVHFKSQFDVVWKKTESIKFKNDFSYTLEDNEFITNGNIELHSTIEAIKQAKATWSMENKESTILNNVQFFYKSKNVFQNSIKGFFEKEDGLFKLDFNGFMRIMSNEPFKVTNSLVYQKGLRIDNNFSLMKDTLQAYSHSIVVKPSEITVKMLIVDTEFKTIEFKALYEVNGNKETRNIWMKIGERYLFKTVVQVTQRDDTTKIYDTDVLSELYSDYLPTKSYKKKMNYILTPTYFKLETDITTATSVLLKSNIELTVEPTNQMIKITMETKLKQLSLFELEFENRPRIDKPKLIKFKLSYNDVLKIKSKIQVQDSKLDVDISYQYRQFLRYFRLKHDWTLMGYEQLLETNLFGSTLKVVSSSEGRGGVAFHTTLTTELPFLKSLDLVGKFSTRDQQVNIVYKFNRFESSDEVMKLTYSKKGFAYLFSITSQTLISSTLNLNLNDLKRVFFEFRTLNKEAFPELDIKFDYEGGFTSLKHSNEIKFSVGDVKFHLENKLENVKLSYLLLESILVTNIRQLSNYKVGLEYRLRPSTFDFKVFCNERFVTLTTTFMVTTEWTSTFKIGTSFPILKEIIFDIKHKQNQQLTQVSHSCQISLKSNERKFQLKNKLEWSSPNYLEIESSIVARTSQDIYFIKPKSVKFIHQFHKNVLKEMIEIHASDTIKFKGNIEIPLVMNSRAALELELSKLFKMDIILDGEKGIVKVYVERNMKRLVNIELQATKGTNKLSITLKVEEKDNHAGELEYEYQPPSGELIKLRIKSSLLSEMIDAKLTFDRANNEGSLTVTGVGKKTISITGKVTRNSKTILIKYGEQFGNLDFFIDDKMIKLITNIQAGISLNIDINVLPKSLECKFAVNDNVIKLTGTLDKEVELDIKIMKRIVTLKIKALSKEPYKYELSGKTNFLKWSTFNGEVYLVNGPFNFELTSRFSKEDSDIYNIVIRQQAESFHLKYETILNLAKSGQLTVTYIRKMNTLSLTFDAETIESKKIKVNLQIDNTNLKGEISTPFDWIKDVKVKGELRQGKDETEGSFYINYNKSKEPLRGKLLYKVELTSWEINIETPLSKPLDKISIAKRAENGKIVLELRDGENAIFLGSLNRNEKDKTEASVELNVPKQLANVQLTLNTLINFQTVPYIIEVTSKSNFLQEFNFKMTIDPVEQSYLLTFSHPSKQGRLSLKVSGEKTTLTSEYNDKTTSIELIHKIVTPYIFNGKIKIYSNMYSASPMTFEMTCKHNFALPERLALSLQTKWNDRTAFSFSIDWQMKNLKSFDLKSKLLLAPYITEYGSTLELANKNGQEFNLKYSPMGTTKARDVTIKFVKTPEDIKLDVKTPYELIRSVGISIKTEYTTENIKQTIVLESNYLGKLEMINEHRQSSPSKSITTSRIMSPYKLKDIQLIIELNNVPSNEMLDVKLEINKEMYHALITRDSRRFQVKINSPIRVMKVVEMLIEQGADTYKLSTTYNDYKTSADILYSKLDAKVIVKTTFEFAKVISVSLSRSVGNNKQRLLTVNLQKDDESIDISLRSKDNDWECKWKNSLLPFLPNNLQGNLRYSQKPLDIAIEISKDSENSFKVLLTEKEILLDARNKQSNIKVHLTNSRFEMIVLNSKLFSILISRSSVEQIDIALIVNDTQYSTVLKFSGDKDTVNMKILTYKNSLDKVFEFYVDMNKQKGVFDSELNVLNRPIVKLKLSDQTSKSRKISTEVRFLFVTGAIDLEYVIQRDLMDYKLFWNVKLDEKQFCLGSITTTMKLSRPVNFSINLNLPSGAYQGQLLELDGQQYNLKIKTPYKEINFEMSCTFLYNPWTSKFLGSVSLTNEILGEYFVFLEGKLKTDPEIRVKFTINQINFKTDLKIKTSSPDEYSITSVVKFMDWEKMELMIKLKTRDKIKLVFNLKTPFKLLREVSIEKILWINSVLDHTFETTMEYKGIVNIKYMGGHEVNYVRRIMKFNGHLLTDEVKIVSIKVHGSKNKEEIDHVFLLDIKESRYGYKINGKFNPMFEGTSEIYTPFHSAGVIVLQGRQMKNGIKIQAGQDKKEVVAFEYSSNKDVTFVKVTPPSVFGKPMAVKYRIKRQRRSVGDQYQSEINYGNERVLEIIGKVNSDTKKNMVTLKLSSPMFSKKSAQLKLMHQTEDGTTRFDHYLKIKDIVDTIYKIVGEYFHKDIGNFKYTLNIHHPFSGPYHFSAGHNIKENTHMSNVVVKVDNKAIFLHNGKLLFEAKKINGEFEVKVPNKNFQLEFSHQGDLDQFKQDLTSFYNSQPYISYKADIVPDKTSVIEMDLTILNNKKLKLIFNKPEKKAGVSFSTKSKEYLLEIIDKDGQLKSTLQVNNEMMASFMIGYATKPLSLHATYMKHYLKVQIILKESLVVFKSETSYKALKSVHLRLTKNKIIFDVGYHDKTSSLSLEYHFIPNNFFVIMETSWTRLSKMAIYVTPSEIKVNVNDYFQTVRYTLSQNHVMVDIKNNFFSIKTLTFNTEINKDKNKVTSMFQINEFTANLELSYVDNKFIFTFSNNQIVPKLIQMEISRKSDNKIQSWLANLTVDKVESVKWMAQITESKYSTGLKTSFGATAVISFDKDRNEVIISLGFLEKYFNVIGRIQRMTSAESRTIVIDASVDSSSFYLQKSSIQATYSTSKAEIVASLSGRYNNQRLITKGQLTNTNFLSTLAINDKIYSIQVTLPSSNDLTSEFSTPYNKVSIDMKKTNNEYSLDIKYNGQDIIKSLVTQNIDISKSFEHSSLILYRGQNIWNLIFKTDFKVYEMELIQPRQVKIIFKNIKNDKGRTLSIWTKYQLYEPVERGISVTFNLNPTSRLFEINLENTLHIIKFSRGSTSEIDMYLSATLLNKVNKKQWDLAVKTRKNEEFEMHWTSPENKKAFTFHQITKNGVKTLVKIEIFEQVRLLLKANEKTKSLVGELSFLGKNIAKIEASVDSIKALINENGSENERITLEWTKTTSGEWPKDYVSTRRLIVKQKALNIDVDYEHEIKVGSSISSITTKVKYMKTDGTMATMDSAIIADYSIVDTITFQYKNPTMPFKTVLKRHQPDKSTVRYDMDTVFNVDDQISAYLELSVGTKMGFTSRFYYDPENRQDFFQIHAKYLDDRQLEMRIFNENNKVTTNVFKFLVRLVNEHNLETTLQYQFSGFEQLTTRIANIANYLNTKANDVRVIRSKAMSVELGSRYRQIDGKFPDVKVMRNQLIGLFSTIEYQTKSFIDEVQRMIYNDEFYVDSIGYYIGRIWWRTLNFNRDIYYSITRMIKSVDLGRIFNRIAIVNCQVSSIAWKWANKITRPLKEIIVSAVDKYLPRLSVSIVDNVKSIIKLFKDTYSIVRSKMNGIRQMRNSWILRETYTFTVRVSEILKAMIGSIDTGSLNFLYQNKDIKYVYEGALVLLQRINQSTYFVFGKECKIYRIVKEKYYEKLRKIIVDFTDYVIDQLKDESNQCFVKGIIMKTIDDSFNNVNYRIHDLIKNIIIPRYIVVGEYLTTKDVTYVLMVTSPIPLNDLKSIPDFLYVEKKIDEVKDIVKLIKKLTKENILRGHKLIEYLRWFTPRLTISFLPAYVPDFESYATILGSSVVTFDKQTMKLRSDFCRVVLAKDMRFKKWEIVLDQTKNGRLYTLTIDKNEVSISMVDSKVSLNGKAVELPLSIGTTKIIAFGSILKLKDDILGLTITVDPVNDMFTVGVSGWYHGKVRGLFGNADNEPFNDMSNENSKILSSQEFFKVFSKGGPVCQIINEIEKEEDDNKNCPFLRKVACKFLYKCPFSPMATCFDKVDPKRFFQNCISSSDELEMQMDKSICQSVRSYQTQCAAAGIKIPVPPPCRKCDIKGEKPIYINEYKNLKIKEKVADIVFVIDEGKCLKTIGTQLGNIISNIDENLKQKGMKSTRFGLVTFRGDGIDEAHSHTVNQTLFGSKEEMLMSIKSLQWTEQSIGDIVGAIKLASKYPFREHASKHVIVINCGRCEDSSNGGFNSLAEILENNAIQFSILMDYNFQVKDGDSKKMIFGVDSKKIYTTMAWRGEVSVDVNRPIYDYCYKLTMTRGGVVFNVNYLMNKSNEATQKRFVETFATQVSLTAAPARTAMCKCYDDGQYSCVPLDTYAIFPIKKST